MTSTNCKLFVSQLFHWTFFVNTVQCSVIILFAVAASDETAFVSHRTRLLCGVAKGKTTDWMYQSSEHSRRQNISVNGTLSDGLNGKYTINGSSLIINKVKASDAGIYTCGHGRQLYHKLWLTVSGLWTFYVALRKNCLTSMKLTFHFHLSDVSFLKKMKQFWPNTLSDFRNNSY